MKKDFWGKFDDLMSSLPGYIDSTIKEAMDKTEIKERGGLFTSKSVSISTTVQDGKKVVVKTENGKTTVKVNGKEYVEKKEEKNDK